MLIQIFILSKLTEGNNYPYKLKTLLAQTLPMEVMESLTESKLYYHFDALQKKGLIEVHELIKEENRPAKQVFAITELGREQLPSKIYSYLKKATKVSDLVIGLIFEKHIEVENTRAILEKKLKEFENRLQQMQQIAEKIPEQQQQEYIVNFAKTYHEHMMKEEIKWLQQLICKIKEK